MYKDLEAERALTFGRAQPVSAREWDDVGVMREARAGPQGPFRPASGPPTGLESCSLHGPIPSFLCSKGMPWFISSSMGPGIPSAMLRVL